MIEDQPQMPPVKLTLILDGAVQDVMYTDERLAAILLSNPIVVDISDHPSKDSITTGYTYNESSGEFAFGTLPGVDMYSSGNLGKDGDGLSND